MTEMTHLTHLRIGAQRGIKSINREFIVVQTDINLFAGPLVCFAILTEDDDGRQCHLVEV